MKASLLRLMPELCNRLVERRRRRRAQEQLNRISLLSLWERQVRANQPATVKANCLATRSLTHGDEYAKLAESELEQHSRYLPVVCPPSDSSPRLGLISC